MKQDILRQLRSVSVVVPVFNEEGCLQALYDRLAKVLVRLTANYEIIFVNDGSTDRSLSVIKDLKALDSRVGYFSFTRNFGHEAALTCGLNYAKGDAVVLIDADLQDPPEVIEELVTQWTQGFDIVYAQRSSRAGERAFTRFTSHLFYRVYSHLARIEMPVDTGDFRLMDQSVVKAFTALGEKNRYVRGMISWTGYSQKGVKYDRDARLWGRTKYRFYNRFSLAFDAICAISTLPLRAITLIGMLMTAVSFFVVGSVVVQKLFLGLPLRGYALLATGLYFFGGIQLFFLGIIGEYVGRIYREAQGRPLFILGQSAPSQPAQQKKRRKQAA